MARLDGRGEMVTKQTTVTTSNFCFCSVSDLLLLFYCCCFFACFVFVCVFLCLFYGTGKSYRQIFEYTGSLTALE